MFLACLSGDVAANRTCTMDWAEAAFAFGIALIITVLLVGPFGWRHPARHADAWAGGFFVFLVLFFAIWAVASWFEPYGPVLWGVYWVPFVWIGLIVALVLVAASAPTRARRGVDRHVDRTRVDRTTPPRESPGEPSEDYSAATVAGTIFGVFFWILIIFLAIGIFAAVF